MKTLSTLITVLILMVSLSSLHTCVSISAATTITSLNPDLHPIILIPGSGGNQLEARLTSNYKPSSLFCHLQKGTGWFRMWFDPTVLVAPLTRCFAERMMVYYHSDIDDYRNAPGVETRVPDFGTTKAMLYLDPNLKHLTEYMASLVSTLEKLDYKENKTLFGAPYDFRYGLAAEGHPSQVGTQYLQDLKNLIEFAATSNNGKQVILMAHSLGGLFALQLLNRNPLLWRRKFVKHLVTLGTPWGGTALVERLDEPGVAVTCLVGTNMETPYGLVYGTGGFDVAPEIDYGDGDGTVNLNSLLRLELEWSGSKNQVLHVVKLPGVSHSDILKDKGALAEIVRTVTDINMNYI